MARARPGPSSTDDTVDPAEPSARQTASRADVAFFEVLFHSDLRMVGARAPVAAMDSTSDVPLLIGRDTPTFSLDDGTLVGPLADPCVSRRQLTVAWRASERRFRIDRDLAARRPITALAPDGTAYAGQLDQLAPGMLIAVGDRVLLRFDCGPIPAPSLGLLGASLAMRELRRALEFLAPRSDSVLILGESGTGKELVVRALHDAGPRRFDPLIAVNCAGIPDTLVEAELFGVEKGAFSGASSRRDGLFRAAERGTIFLDEIGELSISAQAKLLRALQERRVRPVGGSDEVPFAARIVMATHRNLAKAVEEGTFRADLFGRIEAPSVVLPPVRDRREDIGRLFVSFLATELADAPAITPTPFRAAEIDPPVVPMAFFLDMLGHSWPRNVREVQKVASRVAMALRTGRAIDSSLLGQSTEAVRNREPPPHRAAPSAAQLVDLLDQHAFVQNRLAKTLGVSRTTLDKWMREQGVRRPSDLQRDEISAALALHGGDLGATARSLLVSSRGLRLRMTELELGRASE